MQKSRPALRRRARHRESHWEDGLFMLPYLLLFAAFTVIPVLISFGLSFTYFNVLEPPRFIGMSNYVQLLLDDEIFVLALKNTLILSLITGPVGFFLCFGLAWMINEFGPRTRAVLTLLFYAPVISGGAYMIWQIIFSGDAYGYLNGILLDLGIIYTPIQWLTDSSYMMPAAITVILWMSFGAGFLSFVAGFKNIDMRLYEAAAVDGIRDRWQELWYITLPCMKPQLLFGAVMSITGSFGVGDVITGVFGYPSTNYALHTLVHHLQDHGSIRLEMGYACAIAVVLFFLMVGANQIVQRLLRRVGE